MKALVAFAALAACAAPPDDVDQATEALCVGGTSVEGLDVSYAQGTGISWGTVKAGAAGGFAIAKASEGTAIADTAFPTNWPALRAAGVTRGAYHFFKGSVDGVAQADNFLAQVNARGGFQAGDLPPAIDLEFSANPSFSSLTGNTALDLQRFRDAVHRLEAVTGRKPIIYTNNSTWSRLGNPSGFEGYPVWLANWGATCTLLPPGLTNLKFWQYSATGSVAGVAGAVDRDRFDGSAADLIAFAGGPPAGATCDNNVPVGGTACNPADPGAQFVCTSPGLPSGQQWIRQACPVNQSCAGTHCQGSGPPPCGTGLFCAGNQIAGSSACVANAQTIFCCAPGHTIVNGACS